MAWSDQISWPNLPKFVKFGYESFSWSGMSEKYVKKNDILVFFVEEK